MRINRVAIALGLSISALTLLPSAAAHAAATCQGQAATIEASSGKVTGTPGPDVIVVTGKVTSVDAGGGADLVCVVDNVKIGGFSAYLVVDPGPGDDVVDASAAGAKVEANLGAGADTYTGSGNKDRVDVGGQGDASRDVVSTRGGRDQLSIQPGAVVDARLGAGADNLGFSTTYAGPDSSFDLGPGHDRAGFYDDYDAVPDPGETSLLVDMVEGTLTYRDVTSELRGLEAVNATVRRIVFRGDARPNSLGSFACDVTFKGGGGADSTLLKTIGILDTQPFTCHDGEVRRAYGQKGDDVLRGGRSHDVLIGGPGRDKVHGGPGGDDVCRAEIVAGKGCKQ